MVLKGPKESAVKRGTRDCKGALAWLQDNMILAEQEMGLRQLRKQVASQSTDQDQSSLQSDEEQRVPCSYSKNIL